jgi:polyphosphate kinase 2 (PPK2 family)
VSREEQRRRLLKRLEDPEKLWKFSAGDIEERLLWNRYQEAYEHAIRATSTDDAPWYVVPADRKWWARTVIAAIICDALRSVDLRFPTVGNRNKAELEKIRKRLARGEI